jgi:hypothetical protein
MRHQKARHQFCGAGYNSGMEVNRDEVLEEAAQAVEALDTRRGGDPEDLAYENALRAAAEAIRELKVDSSPLARRHR